MVKPWMLVAFGIGVVFLIFNEDPVGNWLEKAFGAGADRWVINFVLIFLILYTFIKKK